MKCYRILPMAGMAERVQPIAFSKELYPVSYKGKHYAIGEFSIEWMRKAGVDEIRLVVHPEKIDIVRYYGSYPAPLSFYLFNSPSLPESCLYPIETLDNDDICLFGLPDTLFSAKDAYMRVKKKIVGGADMCLGLFLVEDGSKLIA